MLGSTTACTGACSNDCGATTGFEAYSKLRSSSREDDEAKAPYIIADEDFITGCKDIKELASSSPC